MLQCLHHLHSNSMAASGLGNQAHSVETLQSRGMKNVWGKCFEAAMRDKAG